MKESPRTPVRMDTEQLKLIEELTIEAITVRKILITPAKMLDETMARGIEQVAEDLRKRAQPQRNSTLPRVPKSAEL
jgi:hypothetical protein